MYEFPVKGAAATYFRLADGRVETIAKDSLTTTTVTPAATAEGISTTAWPVRALRAATRPFRPPAAPTPPPAFGRGRSGRRITGFAQG